MQLFHVVCRAALLVGCACFVIDPLRFLGAVDATSSDALLVNYTENVIAVQRTSRVLWLLSGACSDPAWHLGAWRRLTALYSVDTYIAAASDGTSSEAGCTSLLAAELEPTAVDLYHSRPSADPRQQLEDRLAGMKQVYSLYLQHAQSHPQEYDWIVYSSLHVVSVKLPALDRLEPGYIYLPDHPPGMSLAVGMHEWASPASFAVLPPPGQDSGCAWRASSFMGMVDDLPFAPTRHVEVLESWLVRTRLKRLGLLPRLRLLPPSRMFVVPLSIDPPTRQAYEGRSHTYRGFTDPAMAVRAPGRKQKVALLFSGQPRSLEGAGYLSHKWFVDNYDVDVFAHFWYAPGIKQSTAEWSGLGDISSDGTLPATFERLYTPRRVAYEPPLTDEYLDGQAARFTHFISPEMPRNLISYYTSTERTIELFEQYQREQGAAATQYDWIIRSRTDVVLCRYPNLTVLEQGNLYFIDVPAGSMPTYPADFIMQAFVIMPGDGLSVLQAAPGDVTRASALVLRPGVCQGCASTFMRIVHSIDPNRWDGIIMNDEQQVFGHLWRTGLLPKVRLLGRDSPGCLLHFSRNGNGPNANASYIGKPALDPYEVYRAYADFYRLPTW